MNALNGQADLVVLIDVFRKYCSLGPKQRVLFRQLVNGEDLSDENVASMTLIKFEDIIADSVPYLNNKTYANNLLDELEFLRIGYLEPFTEKDYY